jgi:predicted nucleic acid-binding protein
MILVDSSVWIDYFNGALTGETDLLDGLLGREPVAVGDLVLAEVLQGFRNEADYRVARDLLCSLAVFDMLGAARAIKVAEHYRALRKHGITVRKTTDAVIATFCIEQRISLLYADRDFDPFVEYLGLRRVTMAA